MKTSDSPEPNMETAFTWWSELPAKWTPVGWKDHMFRFNVLYNGMISALPDLNRRTEEWEGQGLQLGIWPSDRAEFPGHVSDPQDNGTVLQGWNDCSAPVLWSEWAREGLLLREEVFGHIPGGRAVETGVEPLFEWVRVSIHDVLPGLPVPESYGFNLLINGRYIETGAMSIRYNIAVNREKSAYPRALSADCASYDAAKGLRILEPDGRVRLGIAQGQDCRVEVLPATPSERDFLIFAALETEKGAHIDFLLPMLPTERQTFDRELDLGYHGALAEAERFWAEMPKTAAVFDTPEPHINETIRQNIKITEIASERSPDTGRYSLLTGSWTYADLWATPGVMQCVMLFDAMGFHSTAEKYLQLYVDAQGTVVPHGDHYQPHPGVLGPPKDVAAIVWTSDHGAILWGLASHALTAGDPDFEERVTAPIVRACEFIQDVRRITGHGGVEGLAPAGVATDMPTKIQSVWADAWLHKGLITSVRFLKRIGHSRADEFEAEARDYRGVFRTALEDVARGMPKWEDETGSAHHLVSMAVYGAQDFEYRNAFYLDTGPLVLVFAGLFESDEELMRRTLKWFREGPPRRVYRYDSDCWQIPSLHHEMSSCEPCYSWNLFHSWQSWDRQHFLEGMYSLFAGSVSRQTQTVCETRGGVTGVTGAHLPVYMARLAVIDDQLREDELHLLRFIPLAWVRDDRESVFENMPTEFGPVSLRVGLSRQGRTLNVLYSHRFRTEPRRVVMHIPSLGRLEEVRVNGKPIQWSGEARTADL